MENANTTASGYSEDLRVDYLNAVESTFSPNGREKLGFEKFYNRGTKEWKFWADKPFTIIKNLYNDPDQPDYSWEVPISNLQDLILAEWPFPLDTAAQSESSSTFIQNCKTFFEQLQKISALNIRHLAQIYSCGQVECRETQDGKCRVRKVLCVAVNLPNASGKANKSKREIAIDTRVRYLREALGRSKNTKERGFFCGLLSGLGDANCRPTRFERWLIDESGIDHKAIQQELCLALFRSVQMNVDLASSSVHLLSDDAAKVSALEEISKQPPEWWKQLKDSAVKWCNVSRASVPAFRYGQCAETPWLICFFTLAIQGLQLSDIQYSAWAWEERQIKFKPECPNCAFATSELMLETNMSFLGSD